jgi:hypothetical protein
MLTGVNPLGRYAAIVSSIIAVFWIILTGLVDSGTVKGDDSLLNPVAIGIMGVVFGTSIATTTLNGTKSTVIALQASVDAYNKALTTVVNATAMNAANISANKSVSDANSASNQAQITANKVVTDAAAEPPCAPDKET